MPRWRPAISPRGPIPDGNELAKAKGRALESDERRAGDRPRRGGPLLAEPPRGPGACEAIYALAVRGELEHWSLDETRLDDVAERVVRATRAAYPDVRAIPCHSRWRHFSAGGVDRVRALDERLAPLRDEQRLASQLRSRRHERAARRRGRASGGSTGRRTGRRTPGPRASRWRAMTSSSRAPSRTTRAARRFARTPRALGARRSPRSRAGCKSAADNPMVGVDGTRGHPCNGSARSLAPRPSWGGRLGGFGIELRRSANGAAPPRVGRARRGARYVRVHLARTRGLRRPEPRRRLDALEGRPRCRSTSCRSGSRTRSSSHWNGRACRIVGLDELTGLAEYRNGGLFVDGGASSPGTRASFATSTRCRPTWSSSGAR